LGYRILASGDLLEDLGPVKKGEYVLLQNDGDEVTLSTWDNGEENWEDTYKFHIIIQKPIIIESKRRMK
jgi:hypothetical protein